MPKRSLSEPNGLASFRSSLLPTRCGVGVTVGRNGRSNGRSNGGNSDMLEVVMTLLPLLPLLPPLPLLPLLPPLPPLPLLPLLPLPVLPVLPQCYYSGSSGGGDQWRWRWLTWEAGSDSGVRKTMMRKLSSPTAAAAFIGAEYPNFS